MNEKIPPSGCFAKRLRDARMRLGISQMTLGVLAGIDEMSASPRVNQYERGKHVPDLDTMGRLAEVLGVPTAYLLAEEDELARWILVYQCLDAAERAPILARLGQV
ncbi:Helix-turn-helix domain-containing protein [Formivibrio citricus]|uniref:Helix-turn-helix domain-containing protein n=1 Tax=Formivibrio citricus TaxID=83765 RepID=A0A1I5AWB4_9NEIS|nr:helix-turn-helix transcriptional regulator [Formivibrio citricus]SFN66671.1 Helix-turn-helix domain-containing protein [Formivibrio citricus]